MFVPPTRDSCESPLCIHLLAKCKATREEEQAVSVQTQGPVKPKLYEMRKDQIDAGLDAGRAKATEVYDKYVASSLKNVDKYIPKAQVAAESSSTQKEE